MSKELIGKARGLNQVAMELDWKQQRIERIKELFEEVITLELGRGSSVVYQVATSDPLHSLLLKMLTDRMSEECVELEAALLEGLK